MADDEPQEYQIQDRKLRCQFCEHARFHKRLAQLNTAGASFLGLDWLNRSAECLICASCGYVHWFLSGE